jgi:hypothetical protein
MLSDLYWRCLRHRLFNITSVSDIGDAVCDVTTLTKFPTPLICRQLYLHEHRWFSYFFEYLRRLQIELDKSLGMSLSLSGSTWARFMMKKKTRGRQSGATMPLKAGVYRK